MFIVRYRSLLDQLFTCCNGYAVYIQHLLIVLTGNEFISEKQNKKALSFLIKDFDTASIRNYFLNLVYSIQLDGSYKLFSPPPKLLNKLYTFRLM